MNPSVLIIDDDDDFRSLLVRIISKEGFKVFDAANAVSGLSVLEKEKIHVLLSDVHLPDANGVELVKKIQDKHPLISTIVITGHGSIEDGVTSIKNGAFDYLVKGLDNQKIIPLINKAVEKLQLQQRIQLLEKKVSEKYSFDNIVGRSPLLTKAKELSAKVAQTDATVLLLGDTGTGKEIFAQAIHEAGSRRLNPFVAVNCSSFGKELLESELFGHKIGAFSGAIKDKKGLLEEADNGTLFLDEVGEMNIDLQAKLLRVLETQQFYKVGDSKPSQVNVRIIAATNRNLQTEAEKGNFRLDLFYRLSVFQIVLPALTERIEDIELLAQHFISFYSEKMTKPAPELTANFLNALKQHRWKGNIRELKNVIERAFILCEKQMLPEHLPYSFSSAGASENIFDLAEIEKQHIKKVLLHTNGNKAECARLMNIGLTTLYRKLQQYQLDSYLESTP